PLPIGGFAYVRPRFSAEFDISDEFLAGSPRQSVFTDDPAPRKPQCDGVPSEIGGASARSSVGEPESRQGGRQAATAAQAGIPGRARPSPTDGPTGETAPSVGLTIEPVEVAGSRKVAGDAGNPGKPQLGDAAAPREARAHPERQRDQAIADLA